MRRNSKSPVNACSIVLVLCLLGIPESTFCQSKVDTPIPEYYGTYAISGGKLVNLDSQAPPPTVAVFWRVGGRDFAGSYQTRGNILTLRFPPVGATARGKLVGDQFTCCLSNGLGPTETKLIDDESKNWVRRGAPKPASGAGSASTPANLNNVR